MKSLFKENLIININTKIIIKKKSLYKCRDYFGEYALKKNTLIIIDSYLKKNTNKLDYIKKSFSFLKKKKIYFNNFFEPNFENLNIIKNTFKKEKFDLVIGIGGGSTIDLAKGFSVVAKYSKKINNLQGLNKFSYLFLPYMVQELK